MSGEMSKDKSVDTTTSEAGVQQLATDTKHKRKNRNKCRPAREGRFEGDCAELKGHIYDVLYGTDTFAKTTRKIAKYVARNLDDAGEFCTSMVNMRLPDINEPGNPNAADPVTFEMWKMCQRTYEKKVESRARNENRVFALLLSQCSQALRNCMEPNNKWSDINAQSDVIRLLKLIQSCMSHKHTRRDEDHATVEADLAIYRFNQGNLPNNVYYEKFKDLIQTMESLGGEIGGQTDRIYEKLKHITTDLNNPTDEETETARVMARDRYLGILFLVNSDQHRYRELIRDITNQHIRGTNGYPDTLSEAYDYLVNFQREKKSPTQDETGLSFYNQDNERKPRAKVGGCGQQGCSRGGRN